MNSNNKHNCYSPPTLKASDAQFLAGQLKALAHPARLQILQHLANWDQRCCNDFCACIPLAQSTISQHLKILSQAGIIEYKAAGNCSHYSLNHNALKLVGQALSQLQKTANLLKVERTKND